jgi:CheY-like chemotaxis protein
MIELGKVLVVDVSNVFVDLAEIALRPCCEEVLTASSCGEAKQKLASNRDVDFVLCEADLSDASGFELLEYVAALDEPRPRVLLVASHPAEADEKRALDRGAIGYLPKPTSFHDISRMLRRSHTADWNPTRRVRRRSLGKAFVADPSSAQDPRREEFFQVAWDIRDISATGAFLETKGPIAVGTEIDLALLFYSTVLARVKAEVVRFQAPSWASGGGVGVVFKSFGEGSEELIETYVADADDKLD